MAGVKGPLGDVQSGSTLDVCVTGNFVTLGARPLGRQQCIS